MRPIPEDEEEQDPFERVIFDAPFDQRDRWRNPEADDATRNRRVEAPGDAAVTAGNREPERDRENWVPVGPRSIGGRITSLAVDPGDGDVMYAGTAAGGVYKTIDRGETWFALWHDQRSLSIADIDVSASNTDRVWVATGDAHPSGGGSIDGDGIYLSDDGGQTWERKGGTGTDGVRGGKRFDAIAADPSNADFCFAVGDRGVFWTQNGGDDWERFREDHTFTDVVYTSGPDPRLYIVAIGRRESVESFIIKLDDPRDTVAGAIDTALGDAANRNTIHPPGPPADSWLADERVIRGRVAVTPADDDVVYAHFTRNYDVTGGKTEAGHFVLVRCDSATSAPWPDQRWEQVPPHPNWDLRKTNGEPVEGQGGFNLTLAVDPTDADRLATGMVDLYVSTAGTTGAPDWKRAMAAELLMLDPAHHADHHAIAFGPERPDPDLWVGNDGGIAVSSDWHSATDEYARKRRDQSGTQTAELPANPVTWSRRGHGVDVPLPYSLAQSPIIPTLYGCGFQDNGLHITSGGLTWQQLLSADGGYVAFDADDPHQLLITWQGGIAHVTMPGRLDGTVPTPGLGVRQALWARKLRSGFFGTDDSQFVAPTAADPRVGGRAVHTRENRFYRTDPDTGGETWLPAPAGPVVDLICQPTSAQTRLDVLPSAGARKIGLEPQRSEVGYRTVRVRTNATERFTLAEGDQLDLVVNGTPHRVTFASRAADGLDVTSMTATQLADEINRQSTAVPGFSAHPGIRTWPTAIEIIADNPGGTIEVEPSTALAKLELTPGIHRAAPDHPAVLVVPARRDMEVVNDGDPPLELRLKIDGNAVAPIRFDPDDFSRLDFVYPYELAHVAEGALAGVPARVEPVRSERGVRLITEPGVILEFDGTARETLDLPTRSRLSRTLFVTSSVDLSPMERVLVVGHGATRRTVTFRPADVADITQVQPDELVAALQPALGDAGSAHVVGDQVEIRPSDGTTIALSGTARAVLGLPETVDATETIGPTPDLSPQDLTLSFREGANRADIVFDAAKPIVDRAQTTVNELHPIIDGALSGSGVSVTATLNVGSPPPFLALRVANGHDITIEGTARGQLDLPPAAPVGRTVTITGAKDLSPVDLVLEVDDGTDTVEIEFDASLGVVDLTATTPAELESILSTAFAAEGIRAAVARAGTTVEITPNGGITLTYSGTAAPILGLPGSSAAAQTITGDQDLSARPARLTITDPDAGISHDIDFDAAAGIVDRSKTQPMELLRVLGQGLAAAGLDASVTNAIEHEPGEGTFVTYDPERPGRVWVGSEDGLAYRSADGGASWTAAYPIPGTRRARSPVAVAFHPTEDRTVYVGLSGYAVGDDDPGFLFRSENDGFSWEAIGGDITADDDPLDIRALAVDPGEPDHLYAGTDVGVWHSTNRGRSWSEFNHGLPNVRVFDLAMERQSRTLRAALWGRPIHERRLGRRRTADVALSIRANALDDGLTRPAPIGPDVFARQPRTVVPNDSPDIKIVRSLPPTGFLDGVEFDDLLTSEQPRPGPAHVAVQVNNRGAFPADGARAVVLYADVSDGVPPLPDDLWSQFQAGPLAGTIGRWEVALDETLSATPISPRTRIGPGYPRVFTAAVNFPDEIEQASRLGFLAFCSCPDDELETEELDPNCLLAADRRVAYRELAVTRTVDADTLHLVGRDLDQTFPFSVTDSTPPTALAALGLSTPLSPVDSLTGGREPFNLATGAGDPGLSFTQPVRPVTIEVDPADFHDPGRLRHRHVIPVLNRELLQQGIPIQARSVPGLMGPDELRLEADANAVTLEVTGGQLAAALGLAVGGGPTGHVGTTQERFALDRPGLTLDLDIHVEHTVRFGEALTTADEVREVLNRSMEEARLPIRAEIPTVDLRVRRSGTGSGTAADVTPRGGLADIVASPDAVAPGDQASLFDLVTTLGDDVVGTGTSFLYLRASNDGTGEQADARIRLWEIKPAGAAGGPLSLDLIGESARTMPPGEWVIEEVEWTPDDPAPADGQLRLVLAAIDHPADRPILTAAGDELDDDTEFADLDELHQLSRRQPGLAYRELRVAP